MLGGRAAAVAIRHYWNSRRAQPGVTAGAGVQTVPGPRQIGPGGKKHCACGQRHPFIAQGLQKREGETSSGRFAANNDAIGRIALGHQKSVGGAGVEQAGGELVFGRKAVFGK